MPTLNDILVVIKSNIHVNGDAEKLISPDMLSFNEVGVVVDGFEIVCERPRLMFARVLQLFEQPTMQTNMQSGVLFSFCQNIDLPYQPPPIADDGSFDKKALLKYGANCIIGGPGFGYELDENGIPVRMPHLGNVKIGENVEIGSNVCIDRAVIGSTVIGDNVKIDNLVHIAHGAKIGKNTLIVAGSIIGGSAEIGENCFIGMNASIKNKVKIGNNVTIGAGAVVLKDVPDGETWIGNPAHKLVKKESNDIGNNWGSDGYQPINTVDTSNPPGNPNKTFRGFPLLSKDDEIKHSKRLKKEKMRMKRTRFFIPKSRGLSSFKKQVIEAIKDGKNIDWVYNSEGDEIPYDTFEISVAANSIFKLLESKGLIKHIK